MTLAQLALVKAWHLDHHATQPLEFHAWDTVLTLWLMGWTGAPGMALLDETWAVVGFVLLMFSPSAYVVARDRLQRKGWLRCDWLHLVRGTQSQA